MLHELATAEAEKAEGHYVVPTEQFRAALLEELCQLSKLKPADPTTPTRWGGFVGEKVGRISAEKAKFADQLVHFFTEQLEVQLLMNRGATQIEVACHNTLDNNVNQWGDTVLIGFRLR